MYYRVLYNQRLSFVFGLGEEVEMDSCVWSIFEILDRLFEVVKYSVLLCSSNYELELQQYLNLPKLIHKLVIHH